MNPQYTVVIPAHNRPERLRRLLDYLLSFNCNVVVPDSSTEPFKYIDKYKDKIQYLHLPNSHLAKKLIRIKEFVHTPYVVMCADDDFVIPPSIERIVHFLESHPSYVSGQGLYLRYYPLENNRLKLEYEWMVTSSLDEDSPHSRLKHLMKHYYQFYYAVTKSDVFFSCYESILKDKDNIYIENLCVLELYNAMYTVIKGKHYIDKDIYNMREYIETSCSSYISSYYHLYRENPNNQNLLNCKNLITRLLGQEGDYLYDLVMDEYYSNCCSTRYKEYIKSNMNKIFPLFSIINHYKFIKITERKENTLLEINKVISFVNDYFKYIY